MPAINHTFHDAQSTTPSVQAGGGKWRLRTDEPKVEGAIRWHFDGQADPAARGKLTVATPTGSKVVNDIEHCTNVFIKGKTTTIAGTGELEP